MLATAVVGLSRPAAGWRTCAILLLSAPFFILALPLVPGAVRFCLVAFRAALLCARDCTEAFTAGRAVRRLNSRADAATDRAARIDQWVEVRISYLTAEYQYHRSLAVAAGSSR